jgi:Raf kinase inhibitor-like YbhB/YbcL family protein
MKLTSESFADGERIPERNAFGKHDPESHVTLTDNKNPQLTWSGVPDGAKSVALICVDPDVPSKGDDVNQEGKTVPADLPRVDFYHWVLIDLPGQDGSIAEGELCDGITARGKDENGPRGRRGKNDYTGWFAGDDDMKGDYFGYDGPCPPWNDEIVHHYVFTAYALDVEKLDLPSGFGGADAVKAMEGHILDKASITGSYAIYPDAKDHSH